MAAGCCGLGGVQKEGGRGGQICTFFKHLRGIEEGQGGGHRQWAISGGEVITTSLKSTTIANNPTINTTTTTINTTTTTTTTIFLTVTVFAPSPLIALLQICKFYPVHILNGKSGSEGSIFVWLFVWLFVTLLTVLMLLWPLKMLKLSNLVSTRTVIGLYLPCL